MEPKIRLLRIKDSHPVYADWEGFRLNIASDDDWCVRIAPPPQFDPHETVVIDKMFCQHLTTAGQPLEPIYHLTGGTFLLLLGSWAAVGFPIATLIHQTEPLSAALILKIMVIALSGLATLRYAYLFLALAVAELQLLRRLRAEAKMQGQKEPGR